MCLNGKQETKSVLFAEYFMKQIYTAYDQISWQKLKYTYNNTNNVKCLLLFILIIASLHKNVRLYIFL